MAWLGSAHAQSDYRDKQPSGASPGSSPQVTYTPLRRPGVVEPPVTPPSPPAIPPPAPLVESPVVSPLTSIAPPTMEPQEGVATTPTKLPAPGRRRFGLTADVGLPDGAHLGLVILPANWLRLSVAGGSNSAAWGGRVGLTLVPFGWGPSLSFEAGRFGVANTNALIRATFEVPTWVDPYVQQVGYSYFNGQLGLDLRLGNVIFYVHGGYSIIHATVRSPSPVETKSSSGALLYRVRLGEDGRVTIHTWSGKLALIYLFGGA